MAFVCQSLACDSQSTGITELSIRTEMCPGLEACVAEMSVLEPVCSFSTAHKTIHQFLCQFQVSKKKLSQFLVSENVDFGASLQQHSALCV
jgi:hypothetical protein